VDRLGDDEARLRRDHAEPVLAHRILSLSSDGFGAGGREREIVKKILAQVAVPL